VNKTKVEFLKELREAKDNEHSDNIEKGSIYVNVLLKDQKFKIYCGEGRQKIRWLTDVAIFRFKKVTDKQLGIAYSLKTENGSLCDLEDKIRDVLGNNENVWVLMKEEYEVYLEDQEKRQTTQSVKRVVNNTSK
jgi:hypothetical protein